MAVGRPISLTPNIATKTLSVSATAAQTSFTVTGGYRINELGVYRNGVRLIQGRDFTASDGATVTLLSAASLDDALDFVIFDSFNIADAINSVGNQTIDGELTVTKIIGDGSELTGIGTDNINTNNIKVSGISTLGTETTVVGSAVTFNASGGTVVGVLTATSFSGDGSNLGGIAGVAVTAHIDAASITSSGIVSVTNTTASTSSATGALIVSGGVGIAGSLHVGENVSIGGTLTYEDVTNIDSVGIVTAQTGVRVTAGGLVVTAGVSTLAADLSIADKIVHTGDTNTALRFPSADTITAETGGSERLRITSTGFVGVNETSPACQLHVEQDVDHASTFWLNSDAGIMIDNKNSTANTPKRVLKLEGDGAIVYGSSGTGDLLFNQRENTVLTLAESRKIGIGKTNPDAELHVYHASSNTIATFESGDAGSGINLKDSVTRSSIEQNNTDFIISADTGASHANSALSFKVDNSERVRIDSSGRMGIGTAAPSQTLQLLAASGDVYTRVDTNVNGGMLIYVQGTQRSIFANDSAFSGTTTNTGIGAKGDMVLRTGTSSYDERLRITSAGKLQVSGTRGGALQPEDDDTLQLYTAASDNSINRGSGITFYNHDNSGYEQGGTIQVAKENGTADNEAAYMRFNVRPAGATNVERLRITSTGAFSLNNGELVERCYIQSSPAWSSNGAVNLDNGVVQYNTSNYGGAGAGSLYFTSSVGINTQMSTGDIMSLTMMTNVNSTAGYINNIFIDGQAATETWVGGSAPTAGGGSGVDIYTFNIIKTASATYTVIANQVKTS